VFTVGELARRDVRYLQTMLAPRFLLLPLVAATLAPTAALASPPSTYEDRGRTVRVERDSVDAVDATSAERRRARVDFGDGRIARVELDATVIVALDPGGAEEVARLGGVLLRPLAPSVGLWLAADTTGGDGVDLAGRLTTEAARTRGVRSATPNFYLRRRALAEPFVPNDTRFGGQWYFENLGMSAAWGLSVGSADTSVVVVDTGCDMSHVDLVDKMDGGRDVVDDDDDPSPKLTADGAAHGTQCAGIIGATTDNAEGIAGGCPECRIRCVRMLDDGPQPLSIEVEAFQFALDVDASIVSNSWGYVDAIPIPSALEDIIAEVSTQGRGGKGAVIVFAAGNDDREVLSDEVCGAQGVVCVGAINNFDESTPFTNFGAPLDLVAPTGTLTTDLTGAAGDDPTDYTNLFGGTSSACPVVASIAGLIVSAAPEKTAAEVEQILIATTRPAPFAVPDGSGHDPIYGYGIVDPTHALEVALGLVEPPPSEGGGGSGTGGGDAGDSDGDGGCSCTTHRGSDASLVAAATLAALALFRRRRDART
jgi:serine protease